MSFSKTHSLQNFLNTIWCYVIYMTFHEESIRQTWKIMFKKNFLEKSKPKETKSPVNFRYLIVSKAAIQSCFRKQLFPGNFEKILTKLSVIMFFLEKTAGLHLIFQDPSRTSHQWCSIKETARKMFTKLMRKHLCWNLFSRLRFTTLLERDSSVDIFLWIFGNF